MKKYAIIILTGLVMVLLACSAVGGKPLAGVSQETANPSESEKTQRREEMCFRFVCENMLLADGGVRTNYLDKIEK